ncbi:MAG: HDOD domain-containing protein [Candidatus Latescibacteria bacterium]|nr:HDOD domain-containing protein [Candidatus Latescibacterota bacterium]
MKILLADDAPGIRSFISTVLRQMGYRDVVEAEDGGQAWATLNTTRIDLLLTDWNMPVMSGLELLEKVRRQAGYENLPVLIFTGRNTKDDVVNAVRSGASGYLVKPFTVQQFSAKIRELISKDLRGQIDQFLKNRDPLARTDAHPLILFGEETASAEQLLQPERETAARFLTHAMASYHRLQQRFPDFKVGYGLLTSTGAITKHLRFLQARVKLLLLSTRLPGGGVTLARLASINSRTAIRIMVVCDALNELTSKERSGLERLGIFLIERERFKTEELEQLINEFVFAKSIDSAPIASLPPREIRNRLERDIQHMVDLPVLPQVYNRIVELDRDRDSEINKWIQAIETDPLCQAQVIRRASSPVYGFRGKISEVNKAVLLLGKVAIKELVVSGVVRRVFSGDKENKFLLEAFWVHSVAVAVTARLLALPLDPAQQTPAQQRELEELALSPENIAALKGFACWQRLPLTSAQDPYLGGMMHDIGKAALVQAFPGLFPTIVEHLSARQWQVPMLAAEEEVAGGADHASLGAILAANWHLGPEVERVVENHHRATTADPFSALIGLADFIAGGLYPYPRQAAFPAIALIGGARSPLLDETAAQTPAPPSLEAAQHFLPPGLLAELSLPLEDLVALGLSLAPIIRRFTENMRRSI